jgi:hypothetical protein
MALRNRQEQEELKLKGVNQVDEETDLELGEFTLLQNWVPAEIYSIKKKRGVQPLNSTGLLAIDTEDSFDITTESGDTLVTEI